MGAPESRARTAPYTQAGISAQVYAEKGLGLAYAVEANYDFSVARRYFEALRAGTRAKDNHVRARQLDPSNHDANLIIGVHGYAVASIPASLRWLVYLAGYSGSKERGVLLLQDALMNGQHSSPAALTMLAIIYNRERLHSYSREMLQRAMGLHYPDIQRQAGARLRALSR